MLPKGKSHVAAILLRLKKDKDREKDEPANDHEEDESSGNPGLESAMEDFLSALDSKDAAAMAKALCDFCHIHEGCEDGEGGEAEGDE